jgi:hypothetical protein
MPTFVFLVIQVAHAFDLDWTSISAVSVIVGFVELH